MSIEPDSSNSEINQKDELEPGGSDQSLLTAGLGKKQIFGQSAFKANMSKGAAFLVESNSSLQTAITPRILLFTSLAIATTIISIVINNSFLGIVGTLATLILSLLILFPWLQNIIQEWFSPQDRNVFIGLIGVIVAIIGLFRFTNLGSGLLSWGKRVNWDASGTLAEWFGALGQIAIAIIAVYVAWRQYVISKDLTIQQNLLTVQQNIITQQQTIDSYFQGISDLVLDEEGLLEDWPQERAIAEGRTAAIFSSVDGSGKAKILRFLSRSKLLSPLQRDRRLGRAILDGSGGYAEDRLEGVRVIDLGVMLAGADLADNDLRWTDLSEANLIRANLSNCDLVKANLSRTILYDANLSNADLNGVRLFYGLPEQASPRSRSEPPNYETGEQTGAVIENADFTNAQRMSESTRYYCCTWCGEKTRQTIPGGCEGIPNKLGR
ncbi:pentapeptide repeat-containing protein [Aphanizomenon sp. PH219]|nr:pentapeptide repeat-containing protein [Aphanizomenon sp. 202]MDK2458985.1 pentapeptide repeat-containing protein [Aphanizomenon sp. PH219]